MGRTDENRLNWRTLAGVGAVLALSVGGCSIPPQPTKARPPSIVLSDVTLRHYQADGTVSTGHARQVTFQRATGQLEASDAVANIPPGERLQRGGVRLQAAHGEGDIKGKAGKASGAVTVVTGEGDRGTTETVLWDASKNAFTGDDPVHATGPGYLTDANGFVFHLGEQRLELKGGVHANTGLVQGDLAPKGNR